MFPFAAKLNKMANVGFLLVPGEGYAVERSEGYYLYGSSKLSNGEFKKTSQTLAYEGEGNSGNMLKLKEGLPNSIAYLEKRLD